MLNKGTKSEEERRIESIVQKLSSIGFVPEDKKSLEDLNAELQKIDLDYQDLLAKDGKELAVHLYNAHFPWDKMEEFADLLLKWAAKESKLKPLAKAIYQYIQEESKAFSFSIMTKLSSL